jgi:DUF4097 and DUF4098 domain-containing protein YvlB
MRSTLLLPALAAALLITAACDFDDFHDHGSRYNSDFHYNYPLSATGRLSVETFNGSIEVSGWDEQNVDISGTKYARTQQAADDLQVAIDRSANSVSVRVIRPSDFRGNTGARFVIKVPRGVTLDRLLSSNGGIRTADGAGPARFRTSNGSIRVQGLKGTLDAQTSNGSIQADLTHTDGPLRFETSNGGIDLRLPSKFDDDLRAHTSNGGITVRVPSDISARLTARTSNGRVTSDVDVRTSGEISKTRIEGVLGAGGPLLDLHTSNGNIRLTR